MNRRIYNITFHLHTISSILISVALYVIFFAGSFSFFRDEIVNWERGHTVVTQDKIGANIDTLLAALDTSYNLHGRDFTFNLYYNERRVSVSLTGSKDSTATEEDQVGAFFYLDTEDHHMSSYAESYGLGEFLYRLHFFAQIPYPYGYYLSGFMAFLLLFVILTGLIVHWDKIISNFFVFRPKAKWKTIWTDSHTALGLIGFPFQLVFALTGAFFMLKALLVAPFMLALYNGDLEQFNKDLEYYSPTYAFSYQQMESVPKLSPYFEETQSNWPAFNIHTVNIYNYGDTNMHLGFQGSLSYKEKLNGIGEIIYSVRDGSIAHQKDPFSNNSYLDVVKNMLYRLHLADYAGLGLRLISFLLGLLSCYVVLSGVMIWLVARNKKMTSEREKRFNQRVVWWYLAICLGMYPMTAIEFSLVKLFPGGGMIFLYRTFFLGWLGLSLCLVWTKSNTSILRWTLTLGGIFGALIPIINGVTTGQWIWYSWAYGLDQILFIDLFWLVLSALSFITAFKLKKTERQEKQPILRQAI